MAAAWQSCGRESREIVIERLPTIALTRVGFVLVAGIIFVRIAFIMVALIIHEAELLRGDLIITVSRRISGGRV